MRLHALPLAQAEFLAVDTETNGLAGDACELTEVAGVLVGGGELHDRWSSLVGTTRPLSRGIQRFTGITQAMTDAAPPLEAVLPQLAARLRDRVLVAHNAAFDVRVLRAAFARAALTWPAPPVVCTVALARRLAPLQRRRALAPLAEALGVEVPAVHRALPDAETCARVFCALFGRLCAHAGSVGDAVALLGPRRRAPRRAAGADRPPARRPELRRLPDEPGVYVFRDREGSPLYVGKSVTVRSRARAHFAERAAWAPRAEHVDYEPTHSELGALLLEDRLIKRLRPPGNVRGRGADGLVFLRCRLDIAFPVLEVGREPASGHAVTVGPLHGRAAAAELVEQLSSLFGLRHCGRRLARRTHPSAYGQMGRCLSPCLGDLDPNLYRDRLDAALRLFVASPDPGAALLAHLDGEMRTAAAAQRYERAASLRRRRERLRVLLGRLGGVLRATHAGARLVLAPHPARPRFDAFWIVGGRVVDWDRLPGPEELVERTGEALRLAPRRELGAFVPATEVDEVRIVTAWVARHGPPALALDPRDPPDAHVLGDFVSRARAEAAARRAAGPAAIGSGAPVAALAS